MTTAAVLTVCLDGPTAERFEALRHRLHRPTPEALADWLLAQGLQAAEDRLAASAATDAEAGR
jgi:hypothetical protein